MTSQPGFDQSGPIVPIVPGGVPADGDAIEGATVGNGQPSPEEDEPTIVTPADMRDEADRDVPEDGTDHLLGDDRVVHFDDER